MSPNADLAILGAQVRTLDPARPFAHAIAVQDGLIALVGSDSEVKELCGPGTEMIDGDGLTVVPGLTDSHLHPIWGTDFTVGVDATYITDREAFGAALRNERRRVGAHGLVRIWGVGYALLSGEMNGHALRELAQGPAMVIFYDMHTSLVTPEVLAQAGLDGNERFPDGSEVVVRDGVPTGELREFAPFFQVLRAISEDGPEVRLSRIETVLRELNASGLTGAHMMDGSLETFEALRELESREGLTLRLVVPLWVKPEHSVEEQEEYLRHRDEHGRLWRAGAAKFFIDGVIETGTAWLESPDTHGEGSEPYWPDPGRYFEAVRRFATAGFQCITHAIGDRAVRAALDAYLGSAAPTRGMHRIEHFESLGDEVLHRFARESVAASSQPLAMRWRSLCGEDEWTQRLGPERAARAFRTGDMLRSGAVLTLGSDWPVAPYQPLYGMAWARLRRHPGRRKDLAFEPNQRLSGEQALDGYTRAPALTAGEDAIAGRIAAGRRADFTALQEDPVLTNADELPELPVMLTVVGGRVVHRRE